MKTTRRGFFATLWGGLATRAAPVAAPVAAPAAWSTERLRAAMFPNVYPMGAPIRVVARGGGRLRASLLRARKGTRR